MCGEALKTNSFSGRVAHEIHSSNTAGDPVLHDPEDRGKAGAVCQESRQRLYPKADANATVLIYLILTMDEKSIWKGLLGHFQREKCTPSSSAFVQQQQKLLSVAFEDLFRQFTDHLRPEKKFRAIGCWPWTAHR